MCPLCQAGYCHSCHVAGLGCKDRDHVLLQDNTLNVETKCERLIMPEMLLGCDAPNCSKIIEGLYFRTSVNLRNLLRKP